MRSLADIESMLDGVAASAPLTATTLLSIGEETLEHWVFAKDAEPTHEKKEGFRLIALHKQGAKGDPSFNACRETCRELVYHYNLITLDPEHPQTIKRLNMMTLVASHLYYFVTGKLQQAQLGEFCCSSRNLRANNNN
jgi:hypothetical protein